MFSFKNKKGERDKSISWYRLTTTHYIIVQLYLTLERVGIFDILRKKQGPISVEELSRALNVQKNLLEPCIDFLWATTDMFEKTDAGITLKDASQFPRGFVMAIYKPIFDNLEDLLRGTKIYGKNVVQDSYHLQKVSDMFTKVATDYVLEQLSKTNTIHTVVDLGCGSGEFLIRASAQNSLAQGIGIDIDQVVVDAARKNVENADVSESEIAIIKADISHISAWKQHIHAGAHDIVFLGSTILHEFLRDGEQSLVTLLRMFKKEFLGSRFFVVEHDAPRSFEEIKKEKNTETKLFAAMHMLIHPLTDQGTPRPQSDWLSFFEKSGWSVTDSARMSNGLVVYDCRL